MLQLCYRHSTTDHRSAEAPVSVTVVLQWCYSGVTVVLQWCYSGVTVVLVVLQWCYSNVGVCEHRTTRGPGVGGGPTR
jgi:hypothetical protein